MSKRITKEQINLRFNITTLFVYLLGAILIVQLLNLQIVHGEEYREQSNTRLTRISEVESSRGDILDRTGNKLATVRNTYNVELYKTNIETQDLNNAMLKLINVLEKNEEYYQDTFPIKINPFEFTITDKKLENWKKQYDLDENATAEQAFFEFRINTKSLTKILKKLEK